MLHRSYPLIPFQLLFLLIPCLALGETKSLDAASASTSVLAQDPRLARHVSLHGLGVPLKEVLQRISDQIAIPFEAAPEIAESKFILLVDETPVRSVLQALKESFGYSIEASGEPRHLQYRIEQSSGSKNEEIRLRQQMFEDRKQQLHLLQQVGELDSKADRKRFYLAHPEFGTRWFQWAGTGLWTGPPEDSDRFGLFLSGLSKGQWDLLFQGRTLRRPFSNLPHSAQKALTPFLLEDLKAFLPSFAPETIPPPNAPVSALQTAEVTLWLDPNVPDAPLSIRVRHIGIKALVNSGLLAHYQYGYLLRHHPWLQRAFHIGGTEDFDAPTMTTAAAYKALPFPKLSPDPEIKTVISITSDSIAYLWEMHGRTGLNILSDYQSLYRDNGSQSPFPPLTASKLLQAFAQTQAADWRDVEGIQTFRSRKWFVNDAAEIPADTLRKWREEAQANDVYPIDLLEKVSRLSQTQIARFAQTKFLPGLVWSHHNSSLSSMGAWDEEDALVSLRLWSSLTPEQQQRAGEDGLPLSSLSSDQLQQLAEWSNDIPMSKNCTLLSYYAPDRSLSFLYEPSDGAPYEVRVAPLRKRVIPDTHAKLLPAPEPLAWVERHPFSLSEENLSASLPSASGQKSR
jgi:hypothetical protein